MTIIELSANFATLISVLLARKNSIHTWWVGIIGCCLFSILFLEVKFYADVILQVFLVSTCFYGWWNWSRGGKNHQSLPISSLSKLKLMQYLLLGIVLTTIHGSILYYFTDASSPFMDSGLLIYSILAQFLLMTRKYETWIFWIIVNLISVPLYISQDLFITAALYVVFLFNSIWGLTTWKKLLIAKEEVLAI